MIKRKFLCMASTCEILADTDDAVLACELLDIAVREAGRIEKKFSRYEEGNIVHQINTSGGTPVRVDDETADLLDFADRCFDLSGGLFDITSGVLRRAWTFHGKETTPDEEKIKSLLPLVGWDKVKWSRPVIRLSPGMEIDLGGIGKEYAVDRVLHLLRKRTNISLLVNFGGDIAATRSDGRPWMVGIEDSPRVIAVKSGAVATSGDAKKFVTINGRRYGHILNPKTGWPDPDAPHAMTVAAGTCTEAGFLSTLGILNGKAVEGVRTWRH